MLSAKPNRTGAVSPGTRPLSDVTVLDLTWVLSGPFASMILCDLGANVIKVERPPYGDVARTTRPYVGTESAYFFSVNRGKRSICLDLKQSEGRELFLRLVEHADVVMENYTPGAMEQLGVGYDILKKKNPRLVYAAISGFGRTGPRRTEPALDIIVQAMGGMMSVTGETNGPPVRPGASLGDISAALYAVIGILVALYERDRSGRGQLVDVSMLDCQIAILENAITRYSATGEIPKPLGTRHPAATPFQAFPTRDGWIVVALSWSVPNQWELFCSAIGLAELVDDERFLTSGLRTSNHAVLEPLLTTALKEKSTVEWIREFQALGIPCGPVNSIREAAEDPQVRARRILVDVKHPSGFALTIPKTPIRLTRTPGMISGPPPGIGEHTDSILREVLALSWMEVEALRSKGVVSGPLPSPVVEVLRAERAATE